VRERERERKGSYILKHKNFDEKKKRNFLLHNRRKAKYLHNLHVFVVFDKQFVVFLID